MFGLPADTVRRKRTKIVPGNGLNPVYNEEPFIFKKVVLPDLACLRITAFEENRKFIGTRILPVAGLRPGYRHVSLRNESLQPLTLPTLFVRISVTDYVPDGLERLAEALANPIAYQSEVEKHERQLCALTDDTEEGGEQPINVSAYNRLTSLQSECKSLSDEDRSKESLQNELINEALMAKVDNLDKVEQANGGGGVASGAGGHTSSRSASKVSSPTHHKPIHRQDTFSKKTGTSVKSTDEVSFDRSQSLLESSEANTNAVPVEELKLAKNVQKVLGKYERDMSSIQKKYDKTRDKFREAYFSEEEKVLQHFAKKKKIAAKKNSDK